MYTVPSPPCPSSWSSVIMCCSLFAVVWVYSMWCFPFFCVFLLFDTACDECYIIVYEVVFCECVFDVCEVCVGVCGV